MENIVKKKVLFVTEKWCDGNPDIGLTNSVHNLFGSFQHLYNGLELEYDFKTIHYDEIMLKGKHIDDFAQQINDKMKPDVMICTLLGTMSCNPSEKFFKVFKDAGCKIIFLWPDFGRDWTTIAAKRFDSFIDLNVAIACEKTIDFPKTLWTWTPEDPAYFCYDGTEKDIDVLFLGTIHSPERFEYINYLKQNLPKDVNTHLGGGQRHEKLSHEKYAELTRRAKIVINFPFSVAGNDQLKGRVFEATACNCLLLDRKNDRTKEYFIPGNEYVEYTTKEDLLNKIKYYLENEVERKEIAHRGMEKFIQKWSHNKFWNLVFKELNK